MLETGCFLLQDTQSIGLNLLPVPKNENFLEWWPSFLQTARKQFFPGSSSSCGHWEPITALASCTWALSALSAHGPWAPYKLRLGPSSGLWWACLAEETVWFGFVPASLLQSCWMVDHWAAGWSCCSHWTRSALLAQVWWGCAPYLCRALPWLASLLLLALLFENTGVHAVWYSIICWL